MKTVLPMKLVDTRGRTADKVLAEQLRDRVDRLVHARTAFMEGAIAMLLLKGVALDRITRVEFENDGRKTGLAVDAGDPEIGDEYPLDKVVFEVGTEGALDGPRITIHARWLVPFDTIGSE